MGSQNKNVQQDNICTASQTNQPWLDERGNPLPDKQLKIVSKNWKQKTWDEYLQWYEKPLSESQLHPIVYDEMAEKMEFNCFEFTQTCAEDELKQKVKVLIKKLSPKQKKIVELMFWDGQSERQIANKINISRSTVKHTKKQTLRKLACLFQEKAPTSPLMRGKISSLRKTGDMDAKKALGQDQTENHQIT